MKHLHINQFYSHIQTVQQLTPIFQISSPVSECFISSTVVFRVFSALLMFKGFPLTPTPPFYFSQLEAAMYLHGCGYHECLLVVSHMLSHLLAVSFLRLWGTNWVGMYKLFSSTDLGYLVIFW